MRLLDRGDGAKGHYCIGEPMEKGSIYWNFWNDSYEGGSWCSAGTLYVGKEIAQAKLKELKEKRMKKKEPIKTSLCETCKQGFIREWEGWDKSTGTHHLNRCLLDNSFLEIIVKCNRYEKAVMKTTYHDPEFGDYVKKTKEQV